MDDFMSKIRTYNIFFNNFRKNSYKDNKSPLEILKETAPEIDTKVTLLPPINLDKVLCPYINKRGYHVHDFPCKGNLHCCIYVSTHLKYLR